MYTFRALPHLSKTRLYFLSSAQIGKESTLLYVDIEDTGGAPATGDQGRKKERIRSHFLSKIFSGSEV